MDLQGTTQQTNVEKLNIKPNSCILFFDLLEIESLDRLKLNVCTATKHPANPILPLGDQNEWDSGQASPWPTRSVIYDEEDSLFKCWYTGCTRLNERDWQAGYAISHNGVDWEKPKLGLIEFNGNKQNNIIRSDPYGAVIKDLGEPDERKRYKMHQRTQVAYSADGIHWPNGELPNEGLGPVDFSWDGPKAWDVVSFVRDEQAPASQRYKLVFQYYDEANKQGPDQVRFKGIAYGPDECNMVGSYAAPLLGPNDGFEQENHFLAYVPYKGHWLLLYECGWYEPDATGVFGRYRADIRLAHSRDGLNFARINPHQPIIKLGAHGTWEEQFLVISDKAIVRSNGIYLYYCGQGNEWSSWPPSNAVDNTVTSSGLVGLSQMGLAKLAPDGFTCLQAEDGISGGSLTTKPISFSKDVKQIVVSLNGPNALRAELITSDDKTLEGFSYTDCRTATDANGGVRIHWENQSKLPIGEHRLRIQLLGSTALHSITFH